MIAYVVEGAGDLARRSLAPFLFALVMLAVAVGVRSDATESGPMRDGLGSHRPGQRLRFLLTVGSTGDLRPDGAARDARLPWFQIHEIDRTGRERLVESVWSPSPSAGPVQEIIAGPGGTFVAAASRAKPCESRLYQFRLTADGHATRIRPLAGSITPMLVAGLAISPDGRRIAYTTAPCADYPATPLPEAPLRPPVAASSSATLTVLDMATGHRRTWTTDKLSIVGDIVWARDSHTIGYAIASITHQAPTSLPPSATDSGLPPGDSVADVTVYALDTNFPGTDLLVGRILLHAPDDSGTVTTAVMNPDARSGYGVMLKGRPASTALFSFAEGRPMRVTATIPNSPMMAVAVRTDDGPRYACRTGVDAFGRVIEGTLMAGASGLRACGVAYGS